jgi:hypothetical protein
MPMCKYRNHDVPEENFDYRLVRNRRTRYKACRQCITGSKARTKGRRTATRQENVHEAAARKIIEARKRKAALDDQELQIKQADILRKEEEKRLSLRQYTIAPPGRSFPSIDVPTQVGIGIAVCGYGGLGISPTVSIGLGIMGRALFQQYSQTTPTHFNRIISNVVRSNPTTVVVEEQVPSTVVEEQIPTTVVVEEIPSTVVVEEIPTTTVDEDIDTFLPYKPKEDISALNFRCIVFGASGTGKTVFTEWLLSECHDKFGRIFLFTGTYVAYTNHTQWTFLPHQDVVNCAEGDDKTLRDKLEKVRAYASQEEKPTLLVIDDWLPHGIHNLQNSQTTSSGYLQQLFKTARHSKLGLLLITQQYDGATGVGTLLPAQATMFAYPDRGLSKAKQKKLLSLKPGGCDEEALFVHHQKILKHFKGGERVSYVVQPTDGDDNVVDSPHLLLRYTKPTAMRVSYHSDKPSIFEERKRRRDDGHDRNIRRRLDESSDEDEDGDNTSSTEPYTAVGKSTPQPAQQSTPNGQRGGRQVMGSDRGSQLAVLGLNIFLRGIAWKSKVKTKEPEAPKLKREEPEVPKVKTVTTTNTNTNTVKTKTTHDNPLYKTSMCRNIIGIGMCRYGERCLFAHSESELRPRPIL